MTHHLLVNPETGGKTVVTNIGLQNMKKLNPTLYKKLKYIGPCDEAGNTQAPPPPGVQHGKEESMQDIFNTDDKKLPPPPPPVKEKSQRKAKPTPPVDEAVTKTAQNEQAGNEFNAAENTGEVKTDEPKVEDTASVTHIPPVDEDDDQNGTADGEQK